ncbi:hypothetical protein GZ353_004558 [Salmonella enterica]|uniref:Uncharacterized protein n=1 Tax=Salmonella enterica subsp. houtenae serovar 48:g,z51:- TaxID=1050190 RepID=A0A727TLQ3_SALHO|nr:hypothetical protein [Salmonella enterica]EDS0024746.1 hypothetical protein [Salmonella enterica subsp. enterica serovar Carswell]EDU8139857.1 hypothetical protein [Salmonella enterica subsp. houtenae]HAE2228679.1 hypothetical protein [Salmonella enterica subsp. houtenae serovar 48:g,z51:-]EDR4017931.1 hypothetical protein [Salmonella enterica]
MFRFSYQPQGCRLNGAFTEILDDRLALVKLLVPIDDWRLIGYGYHNYIIDL